MRPRFALLAVIPVALAAALALTRPAAAQWTICNESSYITEIAVSYPEGDKRVTEGWTRVRPGECQITRRTALTPGPHYVYAHSSPAHRGGMREWSGTKALCVDQKDFNLTGESPCLAGADTRFFIEVPVDGPAKRTALVDPSFEKANLAGPDVAANLARLRVAGIQRLLTDAGYYDRPADGYTSLRMQRAIEKFITDQKLQRLPQDSELIDLLENAALQHQDDAGLKVCNRATALIWTAVAMRSDEGWESRGWWPLRQNECARVLDQPLTEPAYYVYAAMTDPAGKGDHSLVTADEAFCLAPTRFAILGREACTKRGYDEGKFATVLTRDRKFATVEFAGSDFVGGAAPAAASTKATPARAAAPAPR
jgi:uncharacterized membrane protein